MHIFAKKNWKTCDCSRHDSRAILVRLLDTAARVRTSNLKPPQLNKIFIIIKNHNDLRGVFSSDSMTFFWRGICMLRRWSLFLSTSAKGESNLRGRTCHNLVDSFDNLNEVYHFLVLIRCLGANSFLNAFPPQVILRTAPNTLRPSLVVLFFFRQQVVGSKGSVNVSSNIASTRVSMVRWMRKMERFITFGTDLDYAILCFSLRPFIYRSTLGCPGGPYDSAEWALVP